MSAANTVVPVPACSMPPLPPSALETTSVSVRAKRSVALFVTAPLPSVPLLPALPTCSVPALTSVVPA